MSFDNWKSQASGVISWKDAELGYDAGVTDHQAEMSKPQGRDTCKHDPPHEKRYIGMRFACGCEQTSSMIGTEIWYDVYCRIHDKPTRRYCSRCHARAEGRDEGRAEGRDEGLLEAAKAYCERCAAGDPVVGNLHIELKGFWFHEEDGAYYSCDAGDIHCLRGVK